MSELKVSVNYWPKQMHAIQTRKLVETENQDYS